MLGPLGRSLRVLDERESNVKQRIAALTQPVAAPNDLAYARNRLSLLSDMARSLGIEEDSVKQRMERLKRDRPRGVWAWVSGRTKVHDRLTAVCLAEHERITDAATAAKTQAKRLEQSMKPREHGWNLKVSSIMAERSSRLATMNSELQWLADAREVLKEDPHLASAPTANLTAAVTKRQRARDPDKHKPVFSLLAQARANARLPVYKPR